MSIFKDVKDFPVYSISPDFPIFLNRVTNRKTLSSPPNIHWRARSMISGKWSSRKKSTRLLCWTLFMKKTRFVSEPYTFYYSRISLSRLPCISNISLCRTKYLVPRMRFQANFLSLSRRNILVPWRFEIERFYCTSFRNSGWTIT